MKTADGQEVVAGMLCWNDQGDEFIVFPDDIQRMILYGSHRSGSHRFYADFGKLCEYRIALAQSVCKDVVEYWTERKVEHEQRICVDAQADQPVI